ncbi:MAG: TonB-dependent receptor [Pseudomonadota bacterium]
MRRYGSMLASVLATLTLPAQAATLEEVTVEGRKVNLVGSSSSASEGLVSHEELSIRPLLRTGEILETVPGMIATQHSGSGKANQYFLRGFNLDHGTDFATFVDGMPVNMRTHGHGQGYTDLNFVIPEMVEEIFYQKGAYYAHVGDFSGAGAASIRSIDHTTGHQVEIDLGQDAYRRLLARGDTSVGGGTFFYGLELQSYDGPWTDISEDVDKINLWLKQRWTEGENTFHLTFMGYNNQWNSADQIPERAVTQGIISDLGSIDTTVGGDSSRYSLSFDWQRQGDTSAWNATAYLIDYNLNLFSNFSYFTDPAGDQFKQVDDRRIFGWDASYALAGSLGGMEIQNRLGSQMRYDRIDQVGLLRSNARVVTGVSRLDAVNQWSASLYWQSELAMTETLRANLGLRYERFDFEVNPLQSGDPLAVSQNGGSANDSIVTSTFGLSWAINEQMELYASIGEGFHSNDARGTTIRVNPNDSTEALDRVDPLVPTLGYEIGWRTFLSDRLNASIALWRLKLDSELIFVGDEGSTEDTGESSTREGIELTAYYYLNDTLTLDIEYAWTDASFDAPVDGSTAIPGAISSVFSGGVNADFGNGIYTNFRIRHFGDYPLDGGSTASASTIANLRLGYQPNPQWSLSLDVLNIFNSSDRDVEYFYESQLPGELAPVEDRHFHVFEPRTLRAKVAYRF